ncbi:peptidoglycan/xylan/chitin deacetylase (PgdA/CDA1 family) [Bacillus thermophilus]|uniref:Peptidoglycan/xylan/chitin deacetylase (PgdA/CDA1 family) n=1 Tax=Siminovitchia thermophila TaxID=1245522 RepID=A0ABS2RAR6_9BACI|nr:polysaccharide deacetylase family protein [Siminovitchia thermophila]MBM7716756.1 peptidoglycan/xylan/chitin deacetylase (PgdA/CDA1 family) [Siminovitchia thermophila]ONK23715.1 polysaccharide deacetylase [Bacillus sp. VT-16-64]
MKWFYIMLCAMFLLGCSSEAGTETEKAGGKGSTPQDEGTEKKSRNDDKEVDSKEEQAENKEENEIEKAQAKPEYKMNEMYALEPIADANPQVVLLTIDDAPDKYALDMAHILKKLEAPAIFFVNGHFINTPEKEKMLKEIYDLGFVIGNHTYSHSDLTTLPEEKQLEEIVSVNDIVEKVTGERPKFFRAPFGKNTDKSKEIAAQEGMVLMNWTYGYDWESQYKTGDAISDIMVNTPYLQNGANLLMHDREWTRDGLEKMVQGLREKGYDMADPNLIAIE